MTPALMTALTQGSLTTVYVASGDRVRGHRYAEHRFEMMRTAYEHVIGSSDWDCGDIDIAGLPVRHCRLRDRPVSMIRLDVPDGGRNDERADSLLHLIENTTSSLPIAGPRAGRVTTASLTAELAEIIAVTAPDELHTLDLAASHGDDHPDHLITASFALWAAASAGYTGTIVSHRGYSVMAEPANLSDTAYAFVEPLLGYFEACFAGCAPCGTSCATIGAAHEAWVRRQYASVAAPASATGRLESADAPGACLALADDMSIGLGDCATATPLRLGEDRHLRVAGLCAASASDNDVAMTLAPCADDPAQYWLLDDEGLLANGRPPVSVADMYFDHLRCLHAGRGMRAGAPICGSRLRPRWHMML